MEKARFLDILHSSGRWGQKQKGFQWKIRSAWYHHSQGDSKLWITIILHRPYIGLIYGRYLQFRILKWRYVSTIFLAMFCWDIPETMAIDILNSSKTGHIVKAFVAFGGNELGTHLGPDFATLVETHLGQSTLTHHEGVPFITMAWLLPEPLRWINPAGLQLWSYGSGFGWSMGMIFEGLDTLKYQCLSRYMTQCRNYQWC